MAEGEGLVAVVAEGEGLAAESVMLCSSEQKTALEIRNGLAQIDYLTYLIVELGAREIRESHVRELQKIAIEGIYGCGGEYVDALTLRTISDGTHKPPHVADVRNLITECVEWVNSERIKGRQEIECAAYAMWRINWIHPFRGGNGRTARMVAYAIICMALKHMLPGVPSIPLQIQLRRDEYISLLRVVDASLKEKLDVENGAGGDGAGTGDGVAEPDGTDGVVAEPDGTDVPASTSMSELLTMPDLTPLVEFLGPMVEAQIQAGVHEAEKLSASTEPSSK